MKIPVPARTVVAPARVVPPPDVAPTDDAITGNTVAIAAGRVYPVDRPPIEDGVIVVENGVIRAVGPRRDTPIRKGIPVVTTAVVTPGLIDGLSCVGLSGMLNVRADQDQEEPSDPNQADLRTLDGFNPREPQIAGIRERAPSRPKRSLPGTGGS